MKMEIESSILPDNSALKEYHLKEKWSLLIDNKTNKKQIWNDIATGLSEQGFLVRGGD
ncbi:Uncharacterized protein APZ42_001082 [Daphnia magna]|uniref:Uncharacterized protein n=1 Tax=Daphnia magna TaxID=35525 RepID=A0A162D155_9CRUS|nr:Uncharacterized protein APZ42_001082 [Daphnia magna]